MFDNSDRRDSNCTTFPTGGEVIISTEAGVEDKRATYCTTFPTSDDLFVPIPEPTVTNATRQSVTRQVLDNGSRQSPSLAQTLTCRNSSSGILPAKRSLETETRAGKRFGGPFCKDGSPWTRFRPFAKLGTSETTFLAAGSSGRLSDIVVVKELKDLDSKFTRDLIRVAHPSIVHLKDAWFRTDTAYLIYERMDITLDRLQQFLELKEEHISTICREASKYKKKYCGRLANIMKVLNALEFVHNELHVDYIGSIYDNVYFSYDGAVKLGMCSSTLTDGSLILRVGNVGSSLICSSNSQHNSDIRSVGTMMLCIMQPGTMYKNPTETQLQHLDEWSDSAVDFLRATNTSCIESLLEVSGLECVNILVLRSHATN